MRGGLPNELEERRVIRLLAAAVDAVPPLHDAEVETLVRLAAASPSSRRPRRRSGPGRRTLLAAAVAATALVAVLPIHRHEPPPPSTAGDASPLVSFPEGSALSLLLMRPVERRA